MRGRNQARVFGRWGEAVFADHVQQSEDPQALNATTPYLDGGTDGYKAVSGFSDSKPGNDTPSLVPISAVEECSQRSSEKHFAQHRIQTI